VWTSATPPTDITEDFIPGFSNAQDDLANIMVIPPSLLLMEFGLTKNHTRPYAEFF